MVRSRVVRSRLPVVDEQFLVVVIEEAVLVHPRFDLPPRTEPAAFRFDEREEVLDIEEESAWTAGRRAQRSRSGKEDPLISFGRVGILDDIEPPSGYATHG